MHKPTREGWIVISIPVVLLGVMVLFVVSVMSIVDYACDGCMGRPFHSGLEEFVSVVVIFLLFFIGILIALLCWLLFMKLFYSREEIEPYMQYPSGIPVVSKFFGVTFDLIFPQPKN
jgi:hypothetical protein